MQQLVKLKGNGGTKRYEVLVRDAHADNEFGVAPERVVQDVHDPSANSDLDRIVVDQLITWLGANRGCWEASPASFSVNVGMGTIADPKFASFVATSLKNSQGAGEGDRLRDHRKILRRAGARRGLVRPGLRKARLPRGARRFHGCITTRCAGSGSSAVKFLKLDPKITSVAMKDRVPQALVVAICQASKVLGLSCVAKRVDTPAVRDWLTAVGIDYAQGFLLDQPRALIKLCRNGLLI